MVASKRWRLGFALLLFSAAGSFVTAPARSQNALDLIGKELSACDFKASLYNAVPAECEGLVSARGLKLSIKEGADEKKEAARIAIQVQFEFNSYELTHEARDLLDQLAIALRDDPHRSRYLIEGHTDAVGSSQYNLRLSEERAAAVKAYLISRNVSAGRLNSIGIGEERLLIKENPEDPKNRRVEVENLGR